jgi:tRNA dimethylallyltransferase
MDSAIHIIAGPTASGKSAKALQMAKAQDGVIINADATQLYRELSILSARPREEELSQTPHRLYGVLTGDRIASAASWLEMVKAEVADAWRAGRLPIICGGTGFYLKALREGLSPIPEIAPEFRKEAKNLLREKGNIYIYEKLKMLDPVIAAKLDVANSQRLVRAYEVWLATEKPLSQWQSLPREIPFPQANIRTEVIEIDREILYARCDVRFEKMIEQGALAEVEALLKKGYAADSPIMKAVGVPELRAYLQGAVTLQEAISLAQRNTRRYAKRQLTWLRHQL